MSERNYWQRLRRNRMSRRSLLRASARAGVGATGLALVGCGDDDDDGQQTVAQAQQQAEQQQQARQQQAQQQDQQQAMQQEQAEQQAEQQAMQQEQQEQQAEQQAMQQQEQQQAAPQPAAGETDFNATVRIAIDTAADTLDPNRSGGKAMLPHFDTLGQFDQFTKEFVQSAATFEWVDDFTAGIVNMKPGMKWHDGAPVTAEDAKFTIDRVNGIAPYNADGASDSLYGWMVSAINDEVTVEGDLTFRLPVNRDASAFAVLGTEVRMTPKHIIEEVGDEEFGNLGIGSGPFALESYNPADHVFSTRFEDYHVEAGSTHRVHKPWMARLEQLVRPEPVSRVAMLEAGEADMTLSLGWDLSQIFEGSDDFDVLFAQGTDNWNIVFNTERPA